jgi:hypothetical protein
VPSPLERHCPRTAHDLAEIVRGGSMWMVRMYATSLSGGKIGSINGAHSAPVAIITPRNTGLIHLRRVAKMRSTATPQAAKSIVYAGAR